MSNIDCNQLKEILEYQPETGLFFWKKGIQGIIKGSKAGHLSKDGYVDIRIKNRLYPAHRLAWLMMTGNWPDDFIDHINRIKSDNRFVNLREATKAENAQNTNIQSNNTSGYKGVVWHKPNKNWCAQININKKHIHLGSFKNLQDAINARVEAEKKFFTHSPLH
jgi:hypothetical protein